MVLTTEYLEGIYSNLSPPVRHVPRSICEHTSGCQRNPPVIARQTGATDNRTGTFARPKSPIFRGRSDYDPGLLHLQARKRMAVLIARCRPAATRREDPEDDIPAARAAT